MSGSEHTIKIKKYSSTFLVLLLLVLLLLVLLLLVLLLVIILILYYNVCTHISMNQFHVLRLVLKPVTQAKARATPKSLKKHSLC
jgi:hypothetical protein